jgi:carbon storage regulator
MTGAILDLTDEREERGMLVLTRRVGEKIMIGDDIEIEIVALRGAQIKVGIAAPASVPVHRLEIWHRIRAEREGRKQRRTLQGGGQ